MQGGETLEDKPMKGKTKGSKKSTVTKSSKKAAEKQKPQTKVSLVHSYDLGKGSS